MLKKLKSIFIVDEEPSKTTADIPGPAKPSGKGTDTPQRTEIDPQATVEIRNGQVNEKFLNVLLEAMEKSNLQGFDYMEFKQFLKSLEKVEMDEGTKFRSAFATGQTMGATKENLLSSANRYLTILKQEEDRFEQAVKNQRSKLVDDKQSGIAMLEKSIGEKERQITQLTAEIEKAKNEISQRKEEVALAQAKVQQTQSDFQHTYKLLMGQLQEDIQKINSYLS
ncbi:MAG TPA: hypothetical protein VI603_17150 [Saprospiraceae bacterium]|nr:hypothetical protein [Saprospiraceae bacterium]